MPDFILQRCNSMWCFHICRLWSHFGWILLPTPPPYGSIEMCIIIIPRSVDLSKNQWWVIWMILLQRFLTNLFVQFPLSSKLQQPSFPLAKMCLVHIPVVMCKKNSSRFFFSIGQFTVWSKYDISTSFHTVETTNVHLSVANTDKKSQRT